MVSQTACGAAAGSALGQNMSDARLYPQPATSFGRLKRKKVRNSQRDGELGDISAVSA